MIVHKQGACTCCKTIRLTLCPFFTAGLVAGADARGGGAAKKHKHPLAHTCEDMEWGAAAAAGEAKGTEDGSVKLAGFVKKNRVLLGTQTPPESKSCAASIQVGWCAVGSRIDNLSQFSVLLTWQRLVIGSAFVTMFCCCLILA